MGEFSKSKSEEIKGLVKNGTVKVVEDESILRGTQIFGSRFVGIIKPSSAGIQYKSRLVAQNYEDKEAASSSTKARTVQQFTQRLVFSLVACLRKTTSHTRVVWPILSIVLFWNVMCTSDHRQK